MDWHDSAAKSKPPPNSDEPASLRRDIADELGDHLGCAFARERQRTGDDETARRAVLDRFGDPRKIARRLWLDAMKEVIMNQRTLLTTCIILAAACVATATFSFLSLRQTQQANEALQKANVAVLGKLEDLSRQAQTNSPWAHFKVHVRRGTEDGPPVEGIEVSLSGKAYSENQETLTSKTGSNGWCRFGPVRAGKYVLFVGPYERIVVRREAPRSDADKEFPFGSRWFPLLNPGEQEQTIVYPDVSTGTIRFAPEVPSEFADKDLVFSCDFGFQFDGWVPNPGLSVYVDRNGELYEPGARGYRFAVLRKIHPPQRSVSHLALNARASYIGVLCRAGDGLTTAPYCEVYRYPQAAPSQVSANSLVFPFHVKPNRENVWEIELPERLIRDTRAAFPDLLVAGRVIRTVPIEYEDNVRTADARWSFGYERGHTIVANHDNKPPWALLKWADIPKSETESPTRRFVLALYSYETTSGTLPPSQILVHEVTNDWSNKDSLEWSRQPVGRFDFEPGVGWKMFDVTSLVRAQARENRPNYGVLMRFEREDASAGGDRQQYSIYKFVNRELTPGLSRYYGGQALYYPRLLLVEPKK